MCNVLVISVPIVKENEANVYVEQDFMHVVGYAALTM